MCKIGNLITTRFRYCHKTCTKKKWLNFYKKKYGIYLISKRHKINISISVNYMNWLFFRGTSQHCLHSESIPNSLSMIVHYLDLTTCRFSWACTDMNFLKKKKRIFKWIFLFDSLYCHAGQSSRGHMTVGYNPGHYICKV